MQSINKKKNMDEKIKSFLSRLKTAKSKACDERVTPKTIYDRIRNGKYDVIVIDGVKFIVEPNNEVNNGKMR